MHDYQTRGCTKYGADMGRRSDLPADTTATLTIRKVPLDQGGYDPGGAYWGSPDNLYMVSDEDGILVSYSRGSSFDKVKAEFPRATWALSTITDSDVEDMVTGYTECALWSSCGDDPDYEGDPQNNPGGIPLDRDHSTSDISPETLAAMTADCRLFIEHNSMTLAALATVTDIDWSRMGHDFWLTRNGHGAGFGDGDWPDPWDDALRDACRDFGEVYLYVGDDDQIHGG
jgi:hypothetical protein